MHYWTMGDGFTQTTFYSWRKEKLSGSVFSQDIFHYKYINCEQHFAIEIVVLENGESKTITRVNSKKATDVLPFSLTSH